MEIGPRAVLSKMVTTSYVWLFRLRFQLVEIKFDFSVSSVTFHGLSSHEELMVCLLGCTRRAFPPSEFYWTELV